MQYACLVKLLESVSLNTIYPWFPCPCIAVWSLIVKLFSADSWCTLFRMYNTGIKGKMESLYRILNTRWWGIQDGGDEKIVEEEKMAGNKS